MAFQPGKSGNPNGRPKKEWTWGSLIRKALDKNVGKKKAKELVVDMLVEKARQGDIQAIKELGDRIDGRAAQTVKGIGDEGEIIVNIRDYTSKE